MPYWNQKELGGSVKIKPRTGKLGGQRTNRIYNTIEVGGRSIHLMNEKAVSARWVDPGRGIFEVSFEPNEDGKIVRAMYLGPDTYVQLPPSVSAEEAAGKSCYQKQINDGIKSRGGSNTQPKRKQEKNKSDKPKAKGFFGLDRWSTANLLLSIVLIPLWCAWQIFKLGLAIQLSSDSNSRRR